MAVILNFSDIGCLNESAAGSAGAGMASFANAGFPVARGFVITPLALSDFLRKGEIAAAMGLYDSGAEDPEDSWRSIKSLFARTRLEWNHEMEVLAAFGELDSTVSVITSSRFGANVSPVYASRGQDLLDAVKHCWLKWLRTGMSRLKDNNSPALVVSEILDCEVSVELRRKGPEFRARAVFGLPAGLLDPTVSSDIFEFTGDGNMERMEMRAQNFQYIMKGHGPSRVEISPELSGEEKLTGEMLAGLKGVIDFMGQNAALVSCTVCFVSSRPVICSAELMSEPDAAAELPPRERSLSLLEPAESSKSHPSPPPQGPVVATKLFLNIRNGEGIGSLAGTYLDGVLVTGNILADDSWDSWLKNTASESKRLFSASAMIIELEDAKPATLDRLPKALAAITENGMSAGILVPGIRSAEELAKVMGIIRVALGDRPEPPIWVKVMYPSNLFFLDSLAAASEVLVLDLDSLARLMLGAGDGSDWMHYSIQALEGALENAFRTKPGKFAVMAQDIVSTPSMLEFLVRKSTDIICVGVHEVHTVKHIIASVEKRILLEEGRE